MTPVDVGALAATRATRPQAVVEAAARRRRRPLLGHSGRLLIVAADHPARGALGVRDRELAMADRRDMLERLLTALARPGVDGVLGTADVLDDLLLLGALDDKVVIGSMNRGGIPGSAFEIDDRFTGYDAASIAAAGFDGGKMLLRIDPTDPATVRTLEHCSRAVSELAEYQLMAMIEPFWVRREHGGTRNDLDPANMIRAGRRQPRSRPYLRLHLAQAPRHRGHGAGCRGLDAAHAPARRRPGGRPGGGVRALAQGAAAAHGARPGSGACPSLPGR